MCCDGVVTPLLVTVGATLVTVVPGRDVPPPVINPGLGAFFAATAMAFALWFLMRNMTSRMRRMSYRQREEEIRAEHRSDGEAVDETGRADETSPAGPDSAGPDAASHTSDHR